MVDQVPKSREDPMPRQPAPDTEVPIGRAELAKRLDVGVRTVDRMVERGELPRPCVGAGGRPRWLWSFVVGFLRKRHERDLELDRQTRKKLR